MCLFLQVNVCADPVPTGMEGDNYDDVQMEMSEV